MINKNILKCVYVNGKKKIRAGERVLNRTDSSQVTEGDADSLMRSPVTGFARVRDADQ